MLNRLLMKNIKILILILYSFSISHLVAMETEVTSTVSCQKKENIFSTAKCILKLPIAETGLTDDLEESKRDLIVKLQAAIALKHTSAENRADVTQAIYLLYNDLYLIYGDNFDGMDSLLYIKETVDLDPHRLVPLIDLLAGVIGSTESIFGGVATLRAGIDRDETFHFLVEQLGQLNQLKDPQVKQDLIKLAEELDIDTDTYCLP